MKKTLLSLVVNSVIRGFFNILCRVNATQLSAVPQQGPLLLYGNHISFLEVPVLVTNLFPRPVATLAKVESWRNPFMRFLFDQWGGIPIRRGEADLEAFRLSLETLAANNILAIAPEGTRSKTGQLQKARPGIALMAIRSRAPLQPLAHYGGESFWQNLKHLRRTPFNIAVGNPFKIDIGSEKPGRDVLERVTEEIMYQLAAILPPAYRGHYAQIEQATQQYLRFENGVASNLDRAIPIKDAR